MAVFKQESSTHVSKGVLGPRIAKSQYMSLIGFQEDIEIGRTSVAIRGIGSVGTQTAVSNTWNAPAQEQDFSQDQILIPTYNVEAYWKYNPLEEANLAINIPSIGMAQLQEKLVDLALGMRLRQMVINGVDANQGMLNNTTTANMTQNWSALDAGVLLSELLTHISNLLTAVQNGGTTIKLIMPIKLLNLLNTKIINTSTYLNSGSTGTVSSALKETIEKATGKSVELLQDNTLVKSDGKLQMLIVIPNLGYEDDSSEFGVGSYIGDDFTTYLGISNQNKFVNAPMNGVLSGKNSFTATPGVVVRKEAAVLIEQAYQ